MFGAIRSIVSASSFEGIAPIVTSPAPLAWGLKKLGKAIREAIGWDSPTDVFDPSISPDHQLKSNPREWSHNEHGYLVDALYYSFDDDTIIDDFAQSGEGNCALVATIKAAMCKFGNRLFRKVKSPRKNEVEFLVKLRDGESVRFGKKELALTRDSAGLTGGDSPTKAFAIFCYAVAAARRAQLMPALNLEDGMIHGWLSEEERLIAPLPISVPVTHPVIVLTILEWATSFE